MPRTNEIREDAKNSNVRSTSAHETRTVLTRKKKEPEFPVQVIHQIIIPNTPSGLIGEKVVYNEKYLKLIENRDNLSRLVPIPECGYFTITKAVLKDDGRVMVALYPYERNKFSDGTHICIKNMKKYKQQ